MCEAVLESRSLCAVHLPITVFVEPDHSVVFRVYAAMYLFPLVMWIGLHSLGLLKMRRCRACCAKTRKLQKRGKAGETKGV